MGRFMVLANLKVASPVGGGGASRGGGGADDKGGGGVSGSGSGDRSQSAAGGPPSALASMQDDIRKLFMSVKPTAKSAAGMQSVELVTSQLRA